MTFNLYEETIQRAWEVNAYHDLGYICDGFNIEETNRGWENESNKASDAELILWNSLERITPEITFTGRRGRCCPGT